MDYQDIANRIELLKAKKGRAEGRLESKIAELKELGFSSVEEAEKGLTKLESQYQKASEKLDQAMEEFTEKWGDAIN